MAPAPCRVVAPDAGRGAVIALPAVDGNAGALAAVLGAAVPGLLEQAPSATAAIRAMAPRRFGLEIVMCWILLVGALTNARSDGGLTGPISFTGTR